jgi:hypothetical protein
MLLIVGHPETETGCPYGVAHTLTECRLASELVPERTPDGHPQVWLLYRPEPFAPWSDDNRSIHLWVRRADVFTSRVTAIAFLDNLLGYQVTWKEYNEAFPELWIGWARGDRWLLCPAPVDPPGGQR